MIKVIKLNRIPNYTDELVIDGIDYNYSTPDDELREHIQDNLEFIEQEEEELKAQTINL